MNDARLVEVAEGEQDLPNDHGDVFLFDGTVCRGFHESAYAATLSVLHHYPHAGTVEKAAIVLSDVGSIPELGE